MQLFKRTLFVLLLSTSIGTSLSAQEVLSLQKCLDIANKNNLQIRQAKNTEKATEIGYQLSKMDFLPTLNLSWDYSYTFGQVFDLNASTITNQATQNSYPSLTARVDLFNAFRKHHNQKKAFFDLQASRAATATYQNDLASTIVFQYLQILFDKDNVRISKDRLTLLQKQLEKTEKQMKYEAVAQNDYYTIKSQIATEEMNLVNQQNLLDRDMLTLLQTLEIGPIEAFEVDTLDASLINLDSSLPSMESVVSYARSNMPEILEQKARLESSLYAAKAANAARYPTISITSSSTSYYSSNGFFDFSSGEQVVNPYFTQVGDNFSQRLSLGVSIPIFNNLQATGNYKSQLVTYENARLELKNKENGVIKKIQQAYLDVKAAKAKHAAALQQLETTRQSFNSAETQYNLGRVNFYTYLETMNSNSKAQIELLQAKYDFFIKLKILDIYQGKPLSF